jgi:hypothetical protein
MGRRRQLYRLRATGGYDFDEGTKRVDSPWRRMGRDDFGGDRNYFCGNNNNNIYNIDDIDDDQERSPFRVSRRRV